MRHIKIRFGILIVFVLVFTELGMQTFWLEKMSIYIRPMVYLGLAISYLVVGLYLSKSTVPLKGWDPGDKAYIIHAIVLFAMLVLLFFSWTALSDIVKNNVIDPSNSDVIPCVDAYVQRLFSGEKVYEVIHFPQWDVAPTYLTMMWFPYTLAHILGMDYRLFSFFIFVIFLLTLYGKSLWQQPRKVELGGVFLLASLMLWLLIRSDTGIFAFTLELTIAVFYMILALTILHRSSVVMALGILLCLLSRYSLSFWLVSYVLVIGMVRGWKEFAKVNLYVLAGVLLLFFPFIADNPHIFIQGFKYYDIAALGEWKVQDWQAPGEDPFQLSRGFGFAIYFYKLAGGVVVERLKLLQTTHMILSFLAGISVFILYFMNRQSIVRPRLFLMFGLKFFLMIFLVFLQVPYSYLFLVPLFLSIPILYEIYEG